MRQQALWHWLRRSDGARAFFAGHAPASGIISVKDALQSAVAPALAASLGKALQEGPRSAPCHALLCGLSYYQADTAVNSSAESQVRLPNDIFPPCQAIL